MQYINIGITGNIVCIVSAEEIRNASAMEDICTYLLSPKVSSKFYAVYPINIGIIGNIVNSHCGGEQNYISDGWPGCTYLFIQNKRNQI